MIECQETNTRDSVGSCLHIFLSNCVLEPLFNPHFPPQASPSPLLSLSLGKDYITCVLCHFAQHFLVVQLLGLK